MTIVGFLLYETLSLHTKLYLLNTFLSDILMEFISRDNSISLIFSIQTGF